MKLLLNDKEIAHFLNHSIDYCARVRRAIQYDDPHTQEVINSFLDRDAVRKEKAYKKKSEYIPQKDVMDAETKTKFYDKVKKAVTRDLENYVYTVKQTASLIREQNFHGIHRNIEQIISRLGKEKIFARYMKSNYSNFIKGTGTSLTNTPILMRRKEFDNHGEDCLLRNTVGNEDLLVNKIAKNYPMWFIDSGYTNFLEPNKKWHRLVRNHLHYGKEFDAPVHRLNNFPIFPVPWRKNGEIIYVIEPGPFAAKIFNCDLKKWKYDVARELRKYTDKRIVFRRKAPLRQRPKLIRQLLDDDYYCVVSINSNSATEAIWAGVPAITLDRHITNPVTRNKLSDINDLYYGDIKNWLCMLSYSQFTKQELMDGTAKKIIDRYHV